MIGISGDRVHHNKLTNQFLGLGKNDVIKHTCAVTIYNRDKDRQTDTSPKSFQFQDVCSPHPSPFQGLSNENFEGVKLAKRQILNSSKLKELAGDNFNCNKRGKMFSRWVENIVGKGEIARNEQFLLFPQCFQKTSTADT